MGKILSEKFFEGDTKMVAQELLGKFLVRKIGNKKLNHGNLVILLIMIEKTA